MSLQKVIYHIKEKQSYNIGITLLYLIISLGCSTNYKTFTGSNWVTDAKLKPMTIIVPTGIIIDSLFFSNIDSLVRFNKDFNSKSKCVVLSFSPSSFNDNKTTKKSCTDKSEKNIVSIYFVFPFTSIASYESCPDECIIVRFNDINYVLPKESIGVLTQKIGSRKIKSPGTVLFPTNDFQAIIIEDEKYRILNHSEKDYKNLIE